MNILGISCFNNNSSACLVRDGKIIVAAQEERFSRKKYDSRFPLRAIKWCLDYSGVKLNSINRVTCSAFDHQNYFLASAFYPSSFSEAAILVNTTHAGFIFGKGEGNKIRKIKSKAYKPSLGLVYSELTRYLGFKKYGDEFKVMGLAAYGKPFYKDIILKYKERAPHFLKNPPRLPNSKISQFHMDVAASLQDVVEEETLRTVEALYQSNKSDNLCLSGEMSLNCLINTRILKQGLFKNIWIQPAGDNAGIAIGCALSAWYKNNKRNAGSGRDAMSGSLLGPAYSDQYIENFLKRNGIAHKGLLYVDVPKIAADLIAQGKIIGWFQGRLEFGPRALGDRSILGDSRDLSMHKKLNLDVKRREPFRPFAPTVLWEKAGEYFELERESPYMLFTSQVRAGKKDEIPAVVHVDGSSRVQTLKKEDNPLYYDLVNEFYKKTGCPVIINTSFNTGHEPMVLSPEGAYRCFKSSAIDCLFLGRFLIEK